MDSFGAREILSQLEVCFFGTKNRVLLRDPNNVWLRSAPKPRMCSDKGVEIISLFKRVETTTFLNVDVEET